MTFVCQMTKWRHWEELLVMVGNVLELATAEVAEAEKIRKEIHFAMTLFRHLGKKGHRLPNAYGRQKLYDTI